jgi:hypothetical protein
MNRDQILTTLLSHGAVSLIHIIQDVEAGRVRHVRVDPIPGDPAFAREVIEFLRSLGAEVEPPGGSWRARLRHAG